MLSTVFITFYLCKKFLNEKNSNVTFYKFRHVIGKNNELTLMIQPAKQLKQLQFPYSK